MQGLPEKPVPQEQNSHFKSMAVFATLTLISLLFWNSPYLGFFLTPVKILITALHESGHALACIFTGGHVNGLTIVSDGNGHAGLTMCQGGWPFIYTQAGYLGTAIFGCFFIKASHNAKASRIVLAVLGLFLIWTTLFLMSGTIITQMRWFEGLGSMLWGLLLGAGLIFCAARLNMWSCQMLLMFIAIQTSLNALTDTFFLLQSSMGLVNYSSFTDATNMQKMTFIPAFVWSAFWSICSISLLSLTIYDTYGKSLFKKTKQEFS